MANKRLSCLKRICEYAKLKNYKRKIKLKFIIYADFEIILVAEDNGKQNSEGY